LGNVNNERQKIIDKFNNDIIIFNNVWEFNEFKELFENYTYFLNIHRISNSKCLELFRITPILYNFCFVLSENVHKDEENEYSDNNIIFDNFENLINKWIDIKYNNNNINNIIHNFFCN